MYSLWGFFLERLYSLSYKLKDGNPLLNKALLGRNLVIHHKNFYQPFVSSDDLVRPLNEERNIPGITLDMDKQIDFLNNFDYEDELSCFPNTSDVELQYFYKSIFGPGDSEMFYGMIRYLKPRKIIEIGAGYSTLIAQEAIKKNKEEDPRYVCHHVCIEPYRNLWLEKLDIEVVRKKVEDTNISLFKTLTDKDILFVDSSHAVRPQGDVLYEIFDIYGSLNPGVYIHVHDIFSPRDYSYDWIINQRKLWHEQYLLEAFLSFNPKFEIILALNWLWCNYPESLAKACPILINREFMSNPSSFWFKRL